MAKYFINYLDFRIKIAKIAEQINKKIKQL